MRYFSLRMITRLVIIYMVMAFSWWAVNLWRANERNFACQVELLELKMGANTKGINIDKVQQTVEYKEIERRYHAHHRMVMAEGGFFIICLVFGLWMINLSANREVGLARQRRNFLLSITHELKSPLAGMRLVFETMCKRDLTKEQTQKLCSNGLRDADRLHALVQDLLLAARLEDNWKPLIEPMKIDELAQGIVSSLLVRFPLAKINIHVQQDMPYVQADKSGLTSVIQNLLENAVKYSPEGSKIEFSAERTTENRLCLRVSDEGVGIPDAEKKQVFEKFYRLGNEETRNTTGTGLGLYIVNQVVKAHQGKIKITDNLPQGTVFTIEL